MKQKILDLAYKINFVSEVFPYRKQPLGDVSFYLFLCELQHFITHEFNYHITIMYFDNFYIHIVDTKTSLEITNYPSYPCEFEKQNIALANAVHDILNIIIEEND